MNGMTVLAIDTTGPDGGVAVCRDGVAVSLVRNTRPANIYSVSLFEMVEHALTEASIGFGDVNLFAAANGPGSFTGIRVGLAAVQGWSKAFGRPARGVSVLEAMVETAQPRTNLAIALLDARRGEFFLNIFRRAQSVDLSLGLYQPAQDGWALEPHAIRDLAEKMSPTEIASLTWVVRESDLAAASLRKTLSLPGQWRTIREPLMVAIARIGQRALTQEPDLNQPLDALYIRASDAELHWRG